MTSPQNPKAYNESTTPRHVMQLFVRFVVKYALEFKHIKEANYLPFIFHPHLYLTVISSLSFPH